MKIAISLNGNQLTHVHIYIPFCFYIYFPLPRRNYYYRLDFFILYTFGYYAILFISLSVLCNSN